MFLGSPVGFYGLEALTKLFRVSLRFFGALGGVVNSGGLGISWAQGGLSFKTLTSH